FIGLNEEILHYAVGNEFVMMSERDCLDKKILDMLWNIGVKKIITRSTSLDHIDILYAGELGIHVANTPFEDQSSLGRAYQAMRNLNHWGSDRCLVLACQCTINCLNQNKRIKNG